MDGDCSIYYIVEDMGTEYYYYDEEENNLIEDPKEDLLFNQERS